MLKYPGIIHEEEGGFWIEFPDLEISGTQGDTIEELIQMAEDALLGYFTYMLESGGNIPKPSKLEGENIVNISIPPEVAVPVMVYWERKYQGLTQGEVAQRMGVSYRSVQNIERNMRSPSIKTISRIAVALGKKLEINFI